MKNKIQYVRIERENSDHGFKIGEIVPINIEHDKQFEYHTEDCVCEYIIYKIDCEPVKIKELDKDIDGNYLECGDRVTAISFTGEQYGGRIFLYYNEDVYFCKSPSNEDEQFLKVRKIPKEEKKVDPIAEEISIFDNYAECPRTTNELCHFAIDTIHKIKQHMEDKKG